MGLMGRAAYITTVKGYCFNPDCLERLKWQAWLR